MAFESGDMPEDWISVKREKLESCNRIKDGNGRLAQGEDKVRRIWKEFFEDLFNIVRQMELAMSMFPFQGKDDTGAVMRLKSTKIMLSGQGG